MSGLCPCCQARQPRKVVEEFKGGTFHECLVCGLQYAEPSGIDLERYYREIWSEGNLGSRDYEEKVKAATDLEGPARMIREIPRYSWVARRLQQLEKGSTVLDVGCGEGGLLWAAQRLGLEPRGCDLSPGAVDLARRLIGEDKVHLGTVEQLPYRPGTFDCVVALEVLEHLPEPRPFLERVASLVKPGGILILTTPNRNRVFAVLKRGLGLPHSNTDYPPHHFTRWSNAVLGNLLRCYFEDVSIGSLPYHFHRPAGRCLSLPVHALTLGRMGQSLCAQARGPRLSSTTPESGVKVSSSIHD